MNVRDVFLKDPLEWRLANDGVSSNNTEDLDTLRYELETFVCEGEYENGLTRILKGFVDNYGREQKAAWVSGFYGSGKSHLVKVLRHLWTDRELPGKHPELPGRDRARALAKLPQGVTELLKEVSTLGKQAGGLHSAGGTLKAGAGSVRLRLLGVVFQSVGLPEKLSVGRFVMHLAEEGKRNAVEASIRAAGKQPAMEFAGLYTSKVLHEAYLASFPHMKDVKNVAEALRAQYPAKTEELSIDEMVKVLRQALSREKGLPCTVIVLDEVQQFISSSPETALEVQEVVEACSKMLDGRVMFVGTGQSALTDTPALQRLMGRFTTKVHLRDNDVERVVRTVVLQKKETRKKDVEAVLARHSGEIARQLRETKLATRSDDDTAYVPDYPLLPVRRRFWEAVLHSIDPSGTAAQMRTQLKVTHEACRAVAKSPLGAVVPADFLYDQLANELVISGEMQKRFQEIVEEQKGKPDGTLRSRICALTFLIGKLPRDGQDLGVRANAEHLADLLTDDLGQAATELRQKLPGLAQQLVAEGVLMDLDGEYRLQTTEGAAWEAEFRRRRASAINDDGGNASERTRRLSAAVTEELAGLSVLHGTAREKRKVQVHQSMEPPPATDGVMVWVRDGFQESESAVLRDIQGRSLDDPTIHLLIPKAKAEDLKNALASTSAAEDTLNFKGSPTAQEGKDARSAILTRKTAEEAKVEGLLATIVGDARVFLSGGQERKGITLQATVKDAAVEVLSRQFPKFHVADNANWATVWRRAKEGSPDALSAVGYAGDPDKHPVASDVLRFIGAGKKGNEIANHYEDAPFGWPKDAIDAVLAVLLVSGHLSARLQGKAVGVAELDQRKTGQADYRIQHPVLTAAQKLRVRKLFQNNAHKFQPGDEATAAPTFVQLMKATARVAGGDAPAPEPPYVPDLAELETLTGNDLLFALHEKADDLTNRMLSWRGLAKEMAERSSRFELADRLAKFASDLPVGVGCAETLQAIQANRSLLDDPNPVDSVLSTVSPALRQALTSAYEHFQQVMTDERARLAAHPAWASLEESKQEALLRDAGVVRRPGPVTATDAELLLALQHCDLAGWRTQANALSTCFAAALTAALKEAEPKATRIVLAGATIRNAEELEAWLDAARARLQQALNDGPVIL
jgi:hypothetical protein